MTARDGMRQAISERLGWHIADHDDREVAKALSSRGEVDAVHSLDEAGALDIFMVYLEKIGFIGYLKGLKVKVRQRFMVPAVTILLTYMTKTLFGIQSTYCLPELLFTDIGIMKVLGFNARWLKEGLCSRSHEKRSPEKEPPRPFSAQMVANFLGDLLVRESEDFLNQAIRCLAVFGVFPKEATLVFDATDVETTERCRGAGSVTRVERRRDRHGKVRSIEVKVFGFKAIVAFEIMTEIPVACIVTKIQNHEVCYVRRLIRRARENLSQGGCRIAKVIFDRGFLDGETLWHLNEQGIAFVVPAKRDMLIYRAAHLEARKGRGKVGCRKREVSHGYGKERTKETLETEVIGVSGLRLLESYSPMEAKVRQRKGLRPEPLNAVVVRKWENRDYGPGGQAVFLTNQPVQRPLSVFDDYDGRSMIENTLFREGKQGWHLESIPQKTQRAAVAHIFVTFAMVALTTAYREWQRREDEEAEASGEGLSMLSEEDEPLGIRRWRRELRKRNKDHVIVFCGPHYGIFHVAEFCILSGLRIRQIPKGLGTRHDIFARYGLECPP